MTEPLDDARGRDTQRLVANMALAMQTAQIALQGTENRTDTLEAALSSLTMALNMEAEHWQKYARAAPVPQCDAGIAEARRLLQKISDLAFDEDVGEPLDDAIGYANKALAALSPDPGTVAVASTDRGAL